MHKLVIEMYSGSEYEGSEYIICLEYKSLQDFLLDLEIEVEKRIAARIPLEKAYIESLAKSDELRTILNRTTNVEKRKEIIKQITELRTLPPNYNDNSFVFAGVEWGLNSLTTYKDENNHNWTPENKKFSPPDVYELNDWFAEKVNESLCKN